MSGRPGPISAPDDARSLTRTVVTLCAAAWIIRLLFVTLAEPVSGDERQLAALCTTDNAVRFVEEAGWGPRWDMIRTESAGRIGWYVLHMLWARVNPATGRGVWTLPFLCSLVAAAALVLAASGLAGSDERPATADATRRREMTLFALAAISLSPWAFSYSIRALGTIHAAMFLSLALLAFSISRGAAAWLQGGLMLGCAFVTHYSTGPVIVALAGGLLASQLVRAFDPGVPLARRATECLLLPLAGAAAAVAPLRLVETWSGLSATPETWFGRIASHENLGGENIARFPIPAAHWFRMTLELEPMLALALAVPTGVALRLLPRRPTAALPVMLFSALPAAFALMGGGGVGEPRPLILPIPFWIATGVFIGWGIARGPRAAPADTRRAQPSAPQADFRALALSRAPLDATCLAATAALIGIGFFAFRPLSQLSRSVFAAWPVGVLAATLAFSVAGGRRAMLLRALLPPAALAFALGTVAGVAGKTTRLRAERVETTRPWLVPTVYEDALFKEDWIRLSERAGDDVIRVGPMTRLHPAIASDEEFNKGERMGFRLRSLGLADRISGRDFLNSRIYSEPMRGTPGGARPGTPLAPPRARTAILPPDPTAGSDAVPDVGSDDLNQDPVRAKLRPARVHPDRGLELVLAPRVAAGHVVRYDSGVVDPGIEAAPDRDHILSFEWAAVGPFAAEGTRAAVGADPPRAPDSPGTDASGAEDPRAEIDVARKGARWHRFSAAVTTDPSGSILLHLNVRPPAADDAGAGPVGIYLRRIGLREIAPTSSGGRTSRGIGEPDALEIPGLRTPGVSEGNR